MTSGRRILPVRGVHTSTWAVPHHVGPMRRPAGPRSRDYPVHDGDLRPRRGLAAAVRQHGRRCVQTGNSLRHSSGEGSSRAVAGAQVSIFFFFFVFLLSSLVEAMNPSPECPWACPLSMEVPPQPTVAFLAFHAHWSEQSLPSSKLCGFQDWQPWSWGSAENEPKSRMTEGQPDKSGQPGSQLA